MSDAAPRPGRKKSSVTIDAFHGGVTLYVSREGKPGVLVGLNGRSARALANRILHELDHHAGKRSRRPSSPYLFFDEQVCNRTGKLLREPAQSTTLGGTD